MSTKKIISLIGTRPQLIKSSKLYYALYKNKEIRHKIFNTGQHYDWNLFGALKKEFSVKIDHSERIHKNIFQIEKMIESSRKYLMHERPDLVLVYGDTNSTLAASIAATYLGIQIAHIEAGLRSGDIDMPEERNRIIVDSIASILFSPSHDSFERLTKEKKSFQKIYNVGDIMYDIHCDNLKNKIQRYSKTTLPNKYVLATIHRQSNVDDSKKLKNIIKFLESLSNSYYVVFPIHPRTQKNINNFSLKIKSNNVSIIEPQNYSKTQFLLNNCNFVVTDSGGIQKESFFHKKPCFILRENTEWKEIINLGWGKLLNLEKYKFNKNAIKSFVNLKRKHAKPYGNGKAAEKIKKILLNLL
tara:strand:+ start:97 stop:1167 length:1071 start_codon:yes stop_codon:yes gene_type:complete